MTCFVGSCGNLNVRKLENGGNLRRISRLPSISVPNHKRLSKKIIPLNNISPINLFESVKSGISTMNSVVSSGFNRVPANVENLNVFDISQFTPLCSTSDNLYRFLQNLVNVLVGNEAFEQYSPLIAGTLLRIRLEFCVFESFYTQAVVPFISKNGFAWILPLHETTETFVAGCVFCVASNFLLIGSTKILSVLLTFTDLILGIPSRILSRFMLDRLAFKPLFQLPKIQFEMFNSNSITNQQTSQQNLDSKANSLSNIRTDSWAIFYPIAGFLFVLGEFSGSCRKIVETIDIIVGRYLISTSILYISFKILHFKIIPEFP